MLYPTTTQTTMTFIYPMIIKQLMCSSKLLVSLSREVNCITQGGSGGVESVDSYLHIHQAGQCVVSVEHH